MIYAIADLHLSFQKPKPMDKVTAQDTVLIPGDFSWAMSLNEAQKDFEYLNSLPRKKNHVKRKPRLLVE